MADHPWVNGAWYFRVAKAGMPTIQLQQSVHLFDIIFELGRVMEHYWALLPIPVAARSKTWVCGRSLAGIAGSNASGGMDVCLLWVLCVVR
jgi:hypothetical protein